MAKTDLKGTATTRELILALIFMMAIMFLFFRTFYTPKSKDIKIVKEKVKNLKVEKEAMKKFTKAITTKRVIPIQPLTGPRDLKAQILLGEKTTDVFDMSSLLGKITDPEILKGISLDSLKYSPPEKQQGYTKKPFTLNAHGSYSNTFEFLERVENLPALMTIAGITINIDKVEASRVTLLVSGVLYQVPGLPKRKTK